jgi:CRISPR/Cas system-associated exonuclease Cas4 (RecB family)
MKITNNQDIALPLAVWLLNDEYDYISNPNYISVTTLMKPIKQIVLAQRVPLESKGFDLSDLIASRMGTALHDSIEKAINTNMSKALRTLGYPKDVIERILVNPTPEQVSLVQDPIVLWTEQRTLMEVGKWTVGGKFDLVAEGIVQDYKSTSAYSWIYGGRDEDHRLQLSIYRWLNQDKITEDYGIINYIFTDWMKSSAAQNPKYPPSRLMSKTLALTEPKKIQQWVENKLALLDKYGQAEESEIPECTPEELWMSEPAFKYYADPTKTSGKSTKNFDSLAEANMHRATKGGVGVVKTIPGEPKKCGYCPAFEVCKQKDRYNLTP